MGQLLFDLQSAVIISGSLSQWRTKTTKLQMTINQINATLIILTTKAILKVTQEQEINQIWITTETKRIRIMKDIKKRNQIIRCRMEIEFENHHFFLLPILLFTK